MKWFLDISTQKKLLVGFGLLAVMLAIVFGVAYRSITTMQTSQKKIFEEDFPLRSDLKDVRFNQTQIRADSLTALILKDKSKQEAFLQAGDELTKKNDDLMRRLLERTKSPKYVTRLQEFETLRKAFRETREKQVVPLFLSGKDDAAKAVVTGIQAERNRSMELIVDSLVDEAEKDAVAAVAESERIANNALSVLIPLGIIAIFLGVSAAFYLSKIIAGPLKELSRVAERISSGDLTIKVAINDRKDEVGVLTQTFTRMIENLRQMNQEIRESVNVLASSASEILTSTTEVASGAAETASAVNETTTTVEEVKQTAQVSSQKARYVLDSSQKAVQVSQVGGKSVDETIEMMNSIREQVESIAESIVKLSEQGQAIGEIIATVGDLAEQSNLLAVNASIEASKAGEHGKGFAVVAQEVKSLAEQSKQATAQVRSILNDIQRATSQAVLATEQGSKSVEAGVKQSASAGDAIKMLAESIAEAAQAATQISASSQQQLIGIEQVISAMNNIRQASEQNVTGTRQTESAAQKLHELGQNLKGLVERYKV
jgi:methyl-accepting chemotaxis protein